MPGSRGIRVCELASPEEPQVVTVMQTDLPAARGAIRRRSVQDAVDADLKNFRFRSCLFQNFGSSCVWSPLTSASSFFRSCRRAWHTFLSDLSVRSQLQNVLHTAVIRRARFRCHRSQLSTILPARSGRQVEALLGEIAACPRAHRGSGARPRGWNTRLRQVGALFQPLRSVGERPSEGGQTTDFEALPFEITCTSLRTQICFKLSAARRSPSDPNSDGSTTRKSAASCSTSATIRSSIPGNS